MKKLSLSLAIALGVVVLSQGVLAGDVGNEKSPNCLSMSNIKEIKVVDDHTLVFHMQGGKKYINHLPNKCSGLKSNSFVHETSLNNYCDLDIITVLDTRIGMRLGSCPLGKFEPYVELKDSAGEE